MTAHAFTLHPGPDNTARLLECSLEEKEAPPLLLNGRPVSGTARVDLGDELRLGPWRFRLAPPRRFVARRKKTDWLARLSQILLGLIIVGEVLLALWLPYRFRQSRLWSRQVLRQKTTMHLDRLRKLARSIRPATPLESASRDLAAEELDHLANYLRTAQDSLGSRHWLRIEKDLNGYENVLERLRTHTLVPPLPRLDPDGAVRAILAAPGKEPRPGKAEPEKTTGK